MKVFYSILCFIMCVGAARAEHPVGVQKYADLNPVGGIGVQAGALAGKSVGETQAQWHTNGAVQLTAANTATIDTSGSAWFNFTEGAQSVTLSAVLNPVGTEWVALALGGNLGRTFFDSAQVWVLLRETGVYQVMAKGAKLTLAQGTAPEFSHHGNRVLLRYTQAGNRLSVWINGALVAGDIDLSAHGFTPRINAAGFRFHGTLDATKARAEISDFAMEYVGPMIPEVQIQSYADNVHGVYEPEQPLRFRLAAAGLAADQVNVRLTLSDYHGQAAWSLQEVLPVSGGSVVLPVQIEPVATLGYFRLNAELSDMAGKVIATDNYSLAVIPQPPAVSRTDANVFGAMVFPHIGYPFEDKQKDAELMSRIGLRYVRTHRLNWIHGQRQENQPINWGEMDKEVALYQANELAIIATTAWPIPNWASQAKDMNSTENKGLFMPTDAGMEQARIFYRELAARYKGQIAFYQIGNEVDAYFWLGSLKHYLEHDAPGIMHDYYEFFKEIATAIRSAEPDALIAPSTTSKTEGDSYRPWLTTELGYGLGQVMSAYGAHYTADLRYVLERFAEFSVPQDMPVIITEIGGISRALSGSDPYGDEMKKTIRGNYLQMVSQLASGANVRALCKFIFREQNTYGGEGVMWAGLLDYDFTIRPTYVAYATLVRELAGAEFVEDLNLVSRASAGWGQGFAFERDGTPINVVFLNAGSTGTLRLSTDEDSLELVDVMGNRTTVPVNGGELTVEIDPLLPLIVIGEIHGDTGEPALPQDQLIEEIVINLKNPGFEERDGISGWRLLIDETGRQRELDGAPGFSVSRDNSVRHSGGGSARIDARLPSGWYGITQDLPMDIIPVPAGGQYLVFKVSAFAKGEEVHGKGLGYTLAFRRGDFSRFHFMGSPYFGFGGTYDWKELSGEHRLRMWQSETRRISLDIILGLSTGTAWVDDVKVTVQLWQESGTYTD